MKLFVHIGVNKTGSSFIQTQIVKGKKKLLSQGVYVPDSKWDLEMLEGKISPGNAGELAWYLARRNRKKVFRFLDQCFQNAKISNAKKVLISNETLIRVFSEQVCLDLFESAAKQVGFDLVHNFAFFRNPISHSLSLFKHRNKLGVTGYSSYTDWLEKDYEFLRLVSPFAQNISNSSNKWAFRLYVRNQNVLFRTFFKDWLGVDIKISEGNNVVNGSLTLKEILLITKTKKYFSNFEKEAYQKLVNLRNRTESEVEIMRFDKAIRSYIVQNKSCFLDASNLLIMEDKEDFKSQQVGVDGLSFSEEYTMEEVEIILESIKYSNKYGIKSNLKKLLRVPFLAKRSILGIEKINNRFGGSISK